MSKRKSIVSSFGDFRTDQASDVVATTVKDAESKKPKTNRVAAGIIGTTQRTLTQIREERDALLEQAAASHQVISLDPDIIDPSPFRDRLPDDDHAEFENFKQSLADEGQKVPVTVRRNPTDEHRFQIVYGHRRWRALKELGREIDAIVTEYSDRDLVIAQGIENASRQDLTWIERALFAHEMQGAGIKPRDIKAALGVDDAELSKFRNVLKTLPKETIEAIGRAPSIGRPRWLELARLVETDSDIRRLMKTLADDKVSDLSSDERFVEALVVFSSGAPKKFSPSDRLDLELGEVGSLAFSSGTIKISLSKKHREGFSRFFESEMKGILERYRRSLEGQ